MGKGGLRRGAGGPNDGLSGRQGSVRVVGRDTGGRHGRDGGRAAGGIRGGRRTSCAAV